MPPHACPRRYLKSGRVLTTGLSALEEVECLRRLEATLIKHHDTLRLSDRALWNGIVLVIEPGEELAVVQGEGEARCFTVRVPGGVQPRLLVRSLHAIVQRLAASRAAESGSFL
jgi:DNA repair protein RadC